MGRWRPQTPLQGERLCSTPLGLALTIGVAAIQPHPTAAATAAAATPPGATGPAPVDTGNTGSFRLGTVRTLGVPAITVASPAMDAGRDSGPDAAGRAREIEGNLSQLYEPRNPCTSGERVGEVLLDRLSLEGAKAACDPNHLGLQGAPEALRAVLLREPDGGRRLAALVPGRASPFPMLTVTELDAQYNGLPADALAEQWRGLLERRLRSARQVFGQAQIKDHLQTPLLSLAGLALLMALVLVVVLWHLSQRLLPRLQRRRAERSGRFDPLLVQLTQSLSRLLTALLLLQQLVVLMKALLLLDDRYAIGDVVEIGGRSGAVVDVGVLSTELHGADQWVVVVPKSHCEQVVNHTKLRSGAEVTLLLPRTTTDLPGAMGLIADEVAAFGSDPRWAPKLLEPPRLLGIEALTQDDLQVKALLIAEAGQQGEARRELLGCLMQRLQGWPQQQGKPSRVRF